MARRLIRRHPSREASPLSAIEIRGSLSCGKNDRYCLVGHIPCGEVAAGLEPVVLNLKTASSQFRGGIVVGLGLALMEETQMDKRTGRIMNPLPAEYHVPVHLDVPKIEVMWSDEPDPRAPMGAQRF